jgi:hypothetical protein
MGHGAGRTLAGESGPALQLDEERSKRLGSVLSKFDAKDTEFKAGRDDARFQQRVKDWGLAAKEIDGHLRAIGNAIYRAHQLSLDIGSDGGGHSTKPWIEDLGRKFGRADFRMQDGEVVARGNDVILGQVPMDQIDAEWIEKMLTEWLIQAASK